MIAIENKECEICLNPRIERKDNEKDNVWEALGECIKRDATNKRICIEVMSFLIDLWIFLIDLGLEGELYYSY